MIACMLFCHLTINIKTGEEKFPLCHSKIVNFIVMLQGKFLERERARHETVVFYVFLFFFFCYSNSMFSTRQSLTLVGKSVEQKRSIWILNCFRVLFFCLDVKISLNYLYELDEKVLLSFNCGKSYKYFPYLLG